MAYPLDVAAQNAALDALLGRDISGIPTDWEVALYDVHPLSGGVELSSAGGYARALLANDLTDLPAASSGLKSSIELSFGVSSGAYSDTAQYAVYIDAADSTTRWFVVRLTEDVAVDVAGAEVVAVLSTYWNTEA